jgi:membrane-associated phospholipid phosphatase
MNLIETVGYEGPNITLFITTIALLDQKKYLGSFILFYLVDYYIIGRMKIIIAEPRPKGYLDKEYDDGGKYEGISLYGMPSGHSALAWYSTVFLWLVKQSPHLLILDLAICFNTMYQRWAFKKHTIGQLAVGMLVGGGIAWLSVAVTKHVLKTNTN